MCSATGALNGGRTKAINATVPGQLSAGYRQLAVAQMVKHTYVNRGFITRTQNPANSPYPEPHKSNQNPTPHIFHVQLLAKFPHISSFSKWSLHFSFYNQTFICMSKACYMYGPSNFASYYVNNDI
jgi:hypothetical protein